MKEIKAIIRDHRLQVVLDALHVHPELPGVTISHVQGFGKTIGRGAKTDDEVVQHSIVDMVKLECVIDDEMLDEILAIIEKAAHTGQPGDGKIAIYDVREIVQIRTGRRGKTMI